LKLLTFPVSGPLLGGKWVMQTLLDEAERRYYDEGAIRQAMADLQRQHEAGEIGDDDFDRAEEALLQRVLDARAYRRRKAATRPD
jgi:hypothetical protein